MANEWLKELREIGVKRAVFGEQGPNGAMSLTEVEFFDPPPTAPQFGSLDLDTLVPPAPAAEGETERPPATDRAVKLAPALSRVLKRGSVS